MNLKDTYNLIAEDWDKDHSGDDWWVAGTDRFVSLVPPGAAVLDAGCGGGTKSNYLAGKGLRVTGIDFSENLIAIARRKAPSVAFSVMDLYNLSSLDEKFDGIFLQAVLLHFPKKDAPSIVRSLAAKLNPGGYFYIAVKGSRPGEPDEQVLKENDYGYEYERPFVYFTADEIRHYLADAGLEVVYESNAVTGHTNWIQTIGLHR